MNVVMLQGGDFGVFRVQHAVREHLDFDPVLRLLFDELGKMSRGESFGRILGDDVAEFDDNPVFEAGKLLIVRQFALDIRLKTDDICGKQAKHKKDADSRNRFDMNSPPGYCYFSPIISQ